MGETLTFGKYEGEDIEEVPDSYLEWVVSNFDKGKWLHAAEDELERRAETGEYIEDDDPLDVFGSFDEFNG